MAKKINRFSTRQFYAQPQMLNMGDFMAPKQFEAQQQARKDMILQQAAAMNLPVDARIGDTEHLQNLTNNYYTKQREVLNSISNASNPKEASQVYADFIAERNKLLESGEARTLAQRKAMEDAYMKKLNETVKDPIERSYLQSQVKFNPYNPEDAQGSLGMNAPSFYESYDAQKDLDNLDKTLDNIKDRLIATSQGVLNSDNLAGMTDFNSIVQFAQTKGITANRIQAALSPMLNDQTRRNQLYQRYLANEEAIVNPENPVKYQRYNPEEGKYEEATVTDFASYKDKVDQDLIRGAIGAKEGFDLETKNYKFFDKVGYGNYQKVVDVGDAIMTNIAAAETITPKNFEEVYGNLTNLESGINDLKNKIETAKANGEDSRVIQELEKELFSQQADYNLFAQVKTKVDNKMENKSSNSYTKLLDLEKTSSFQGFGNLKELDPKRLLVADYKKHWEYSGRNLTTSANTPTGNLQKIKIFNDLVENRIKNLNESPEKARENVDKNFESIMADWLNTSEYHIRTKFDDVLNNAKSNYNSDLKETFTELSASEFITPVTTLNAIGEEKGKVGFYNEGLTTIANTSPQSFIIKGSNQKLDDYLLKEYPKNKIEVGDKTYELTGERIVKMSTKSNTAVISLIGKDGNSTQVVKTLVVESAKDGSASSLIDEQKEAGKALINSTIPENQKAGIAMMGNLTVDGAFNEADAISLKDGQTLEFNSKISGSSYGLKAYEKDGYKLYNLIIDGKESKNRYTLQEAKQLIYISSLNLPEGSLKERQLINITLQ